MKKPLILIALVAAFVLLLVPTAALADNGPHGGYSATNTPDGCAACHRAHTAQGELLLVASDTYALCTTCHGNSGTGANTNVVDGVYADRRTPAVAEGTYGRGLKAGGFVNALMNTDFTVSGPTSRATTSSHVVTGGTGTVWGFGPIDAGINPGPGGFALTCANCHNPHGGSGPMGEPTYRILRSEVHTPDPAPTTHAYVADVATKDYTIAAANEGIPGNYFYESYPNYVALTSFCAQCHTRYEAPTGSYHIDSGDGLFKYRHPAGLDAHGSVGCTSCHVSHGTAAAGSALATGASLAGNTALLRLDNRGVCANCHANSLNFGVHFAGVAPASGAVGDPVVITGTNFGDKGGTVYFGTSFSPTTPQVSLPAGDANWTATSITVNVPTGLVAGAVKIMVLPNGFRPSTRGAEQLDFTVL